MPFIWTYCESCDLPEEGQRSLSGRSGFLVIPAALTQHFQVMEIYCGIKAGFAVEQISVQVKHETEADVNNLSGGQVLGGGTDQELQQTSGASPYCKHTTAQNGRIFGSHLAC